MDGLFPTGTLLASAATRELVATLRRISQEDLATSIAGIAAAIASRTPLDTLDALGVGPGVAPLLGACITDAARSLLPEPAVREWWESAGLDSERASTVARAIVAAAPAITAQLESEGVAVTRDCCSRVQCEPSCSLSLATGIRLPQLVDVKWQVDYAVSSQAVGRVGSAVLRVDMTIRTPGSGALQHRVFCCSPQELEELLRTLKSATAAAQRAAR